MSTRQALLDAIRRDREDDTRRLVYADYLDGDADPPEPERAELIRVQCELDRMKFSKRTLTNLSERITDHMVLHSKTWVPEGWLTTAQPGCLEGVQTGGIALFERGFVSRIVADWNTWSAHAAAILPEHPGLERVTLTTLPEVEHLVGAAPGEYAYRLKGQTFVIAGPASLNYDRIGKTLLLGEWGGDPEKGGWGVTFDLPRPGAHGDQYRH